MEAVIENPRKPKAPKRTVGTKKCFNLEQDVERLFVRYLRQHPMVIEARVINQSMREWLEKQLAR